MTKKILSFLAPAIMLLLVTYLSFIDRFAFDFELGQSQHYELLALSSLLLIVYVLISLPNLLQQSGRIIFCSLVLTGCCLDSSNAYLNTVAIILVLSILIRGAPTKLLSLSFFYSNLLFLLVQCGIALVQYFQDDTMTGSFKNTGVLAIYLSTVTPSLLFVFGLTQPRKKRIPAFLGSLLFIVVLFIVGKNQSRTALISLVLIAAVLFFYHVQNRYKSLGRQISIKIKVVYFLGMALGFFAVIVYSSSIKQMSAAGRVLLNRIAIRHIGDHFWLGTGLGRFTWYYPQWQSDYFLHNPGESLRLSAGESYIIFNEYLQLFETIGFFGIIPFIGILAWFFTTRSTQRSELAVLKLTVVAILACGFTSYPLHVNVVFFYFILCFCLAFRLDERTGYLAGVIRICSGPAKISKKIRIGVLIICLLGFAYCMPGVIRREVAADSWQKTKEASLTYSSQKYMYTNIYPILQEDGKFLTDYGIFLLDDSLEAPDALAILVRAREKFISRESMMALGNAYWKVKDRQNAIACFNFVKNYIPYTFEPKYDLMRLYLESGNYSRARSMAAMIINTPAKIPSDKVTFIKKETLRMFGDVGQ
jgi:hypothetical protein